MWTTQACIDWLATLGICPGGAVDLPVLPGPYPPPKRRDRLAMVTMIGGPGESMEGAADTGGFQLSIRGPQDRSRRNTTVEDDALRADRLIRFAPLPAEVAPGVWLLPVSRSGGRPTAIPNVDDADRITFTCTYLTPVLEGADG